MQTAVGALATIATTGLVLGVGAAGTAMYCKANGAPVAIASGKHHAGGTAQQPPIYVRRLLQARLRGGSYCLCVTRTASVEDGVALPGHSTLIMHAIMNDITHTLLQFCVSR
jgi:hypothetical protein